MPFPLPALPSAPRLMLLLALAGCASPALAAIYKCEAPGGGTSYQQTPCSAAGAETPINARQPSPAEEQAALRRAEGDKAAAQELEREQDGRRLEALREAERRKIARREAQTRCAEYLREAQAATRRSQTRTKLQDREREERKAEDLRNRHFSECFAEGRH